MCVCVCEREREKNGEFCTFNVKEINGRVDKLKTDNGFQLIFRLYFRKTPFI